MNANETDLTPAGIAHREFVNKMTNSFCEGLEGMLKERGDTFAFGFSLSDIPEWPLRAEVVLAGMAGDAPMSIVVLVRPQETADALLDALTKLRAGEVVEVGGEAA